MGLYIYPWPDPIRPNLSTRWPGEWRCSSNCGSYWWLRDAWRWSQRPPNSAQL